MEELSVVKENVTEMEQIRGDQEDELIKNQNNGFHVLAVDDNLIDRKMIEKLLTRSSYHVTCVESGDKALEYLGLADHTPHIQDHDIDDDHQHHYHHDSTIHPWPPSADDHHQDQGKGRRVNLIMTDYSMPGMSGYDLLKRVKRSLWKDVPVVVMSSENEPSRIHMCLEEGAEEFFLKPVNLSDLKKLQPHILKSTKTASEAGSSCDSKANNTHDR